MRSIGPAEQNAAPGHRVVVALAQRRPRRSRGCRPARAGRGSPDSPALPGSSTAASGTRTRAWAQPVRFRGPSARRRVVRRPRWRRGLQLVGLRVVDVVAQLNSTRSWRRPLRCLAGGGPHSTRAPAPSAPSALVGAAVRMQHSGPSSAAARPIHSGPASGVEHPHVAHIGEPAQQAGAARGGASPRIRRRAWVTAAALRPCCPSNPAWPRPCFLSVRRRHRRHHRRRRHRGQRAPRGGPRPSPGATWPSAWRGHHGGGPAAAGQQRRGDIGLVSVSTTTLATNTVAEGHGSLMGVVLIGFDAQMVERTGIARPSWLAGGGIGRGTTTATRARRAGPAGDGRWRWTALAARGRIQKGTSADSRCGNPACGRARTSRHIAPASRSRCPRSCPRPGRAPGTASAALNARLIARVLIDAVLTAMGRLSCPLMIVMATVVGAGRDGCAAADRDGCSGPAASLRARAGCRGWTAILSDAGGMTTDLGVRCATAAQVTEQNARRWAAGARWCAIDVRTVGLGGDSEVHLGHGDMTVGPHRAHRPAGRALPELVGPAGRPDGYGWRILAARELRGCQFLRFRRGGRPPPS